MDVITVPDHVVKYVLTSKEVYKFLKNGPKWYTYAQRTPREGEMIMLKGNGTKVITDGSEQYIREHYSNAAKNHWKYYVITKRKKYHIVWGLFYYPGNSLD